MSLSGFAIGIGIFILCLFLAQALPSYFAGLATSTLDLLKIFLLFVGGISIFIGAIQKGN